MVYDDRYRGQDQGHMPWMTGPQAPEPPALPPGEQDGYYEDPDHVGYYEDPELTGYHTGQYPPQSAYQQAPPGAGYQSAPAGSGYGQPPGYPGYAGHSGPNRALPARRVIRPGYDYHEPPGDWPPPGSRRGSGRRSQRDFDQARMIRLILWFTTGKWLFKLIALFVVLLLAWQVVGGMLEGSPFARWIHLRSPVSIIEGLLHGTSIDTIIGNAVVTEVKGIDQPALGEADFNFDYQRKDTKNIGIWPCWYSQTYHAEARGSAYVNLNPGAAWWAPQAGHYVMTRVGKEVSVVLSLPQPTLPNVHQVAIDNTQSGPIGKPDHSWTYPGLGCGTIMSPHFSNDAMGSDMQKIAAIMVTGQPVKLDGITVTQATGSSVIRTEVLRAAETEAQKMWSVDFVGPTVARLGYHLQSLRINWVQQSPN